MADANTRIEQFKKMAADDPDNELGHYSLGRAYLESDAVFGVRSSLVADWVRHPAGRTPDGQVLDIPFHTLDFDFVLNPDVGHA